MPDWLILTIKIASGPIVGAVIGFFTNWLAVKMLFRPYKAKHIGSLRLPFTPGIIPKRKDALGRALGKAVGTQLLTPGDLQKLFTGEETTKRIGEIVADSVFGIPDDATARTAVESLGGDGAAAKTADRASEFIAGKLIGAVKKLDLPALIGEHAGEVLAGAGGIGGVLGMLGGNKILTKLAGSVGEKLEEYIDEKGYDTVLPIVREELDKLLDVPVRDAARQAGLTREKVSAFAVSVYEKYVAGKITEFVAGFDIAAIVAQKVDEMDMAELEQLFMSVMKKELGAIVNLGGLLGSIVGVITSLITIFL